MTGQAPETFYCRVCGEPLAAGQHGFSPYELNCATCQASYHVEGETATYVLPTFVEHHEAPVVVPLEELRAPARVRHAPA